jgi:sulfur carrier protein
MIGSVVVNGRQRELTTTTSIAALVAEVSPGAIRSVGVALNGSVVRQDAWATTHIAAGDQVEVVAAAQGG